MYGRLGTAAAPPDNASAMQLNKTGRPGARTISSDRAEPLWNVTHVSTAEVWMAVPQYAGTCGMASTSGVRVPHTIRLLLTATDQSSAEENA